MPPTRHELGQWYTPEPIAKLALLLALQGQRGSISVLDPSCGDGVFLKQACRLGVEEEGMVGVDIDQHAIEAARLPLPKASLLHCDFFAYEGRQAFDVVAGNPPYVRQERLSADDKAKVVAAVQRDWPQLCARELQELVGRGDLAAPFLLRAMRRIHKKGRAAFVISYAFFDSQYGALFWKTLAKIATLRCIVNAPKERWFQDAAVHTVIVVFERLGETAPLQVCNLRYPTEEVVRRLQEGASLEELSCVRKVSRNSPENWTAALRASDSWYSFVEAAGASLTTLETLAEVRRGMTSGANDIFYLPRDSAHGIDAKFLAPLLRAPGRSGQQEIEFDAARSPSVALVVSEHVCVEKEPQLRAYLGRFPNAQTRKTLATRCPWWALKGRPSQVFLAKAYAERFVQPYSAQPALADQRVYCVYPRPGVDAELLSAVLNSTATALALESLGRASMGQGALEWTVGDARLLPVLDTRKMKNAATILNVFRRLRKRAIGPVKDEAREFDRRQMDEAILEVFSGGTSLLPGLQTALVATCCARQARSKHSFSTNL